MKCKKCGNEINENVKSCPKCGLRIEEVSVNETITKKEEKPQIEEVKKEESPIVTIILVLVTLCVCFGGFYLYKEYKPEKGEEMDYVSSRVVDYKQKGFTMVELDEMVQELDRFSLINSDYIYPDKELIDSKTSSVCNSIKNEISYNINSGILSISYGNYTKIVNDIEAKYIIDYNKKSCECTEYNIAVLSKDGYVYIVEIDNLDIQGKELVDYIVKSFKKIDAYYKIKDITTSSYVGEANPCGEKVLVLLDEYNTTYIYRDNQTTQAQAPYSLKIYNVIKDKEEYALYINPDRTMQVSERSSIEGKYILDSNGDYVKYYGTLSNEEETQNLILGTNGILYNIDYSNVNSFTAYPERSLLVKYIGYNFDLKTMKSTYVIIYEDGSSREYEGSYESHGIFTIN